MYITGSVSMAPTAAFEVLLGLLHLRMVVDSEGRAFACRLVGIWVCGWVEHAQIFAWLSEVDPLFQVGQDKMMPVITLGTPFKVEIPLQQHWLSTWPTALLFRVVNWHTDAFRKASRSGAGICEVRPRRTLLMYMP
jgi:hypothetical protein